MKALRALLRIEYRHVRTHKLRSWLIVLLVCVPTAAMVAGSAVVSAIKSDQEDGRHGAMGLAILRVENSDSFTVDDAIAELPAGTQTVLMQTGIAVIERPGQRVHARTVALPAAAMDRGGLASTMLRIDRGRAPSLVDEVALSDRLLHLLRVNVGDEVQLDGSTATITGVASMAERLSLPLAIRSSEAALPAPSMSLLVGGTAALDEAQAIGWRERGAVLKLRSEAGGADAFEEAVVLVCGTFGFFEAALIIGAAFAIGMRRRQRELGLLGSNGAEPAMMLRALLLSTAALAAVGSVIGIGLGFGAAKVLHPRLSAWVDRDVGAFDLPWPFVATAFVLGVATAVFSAWLPARSAARLPIRIALGGARPIPAGSGRFLRVGAALSGLGIVLVTAGALSHGKHSGIGILGGAIVLVLGLGSLSPWILELLAKGAHRLTIPWRLAVRDAGRFRARNGPVITAVLSGMSISVLLGCMTASVTKVQSSRAPSLGANELIVGGLAAGEVAQALGLEFDGNVRDVTVPASEEKTEPRARFMVTTATPITTATAERAIEVAALYTATSVSATALDRAPGGSVFQVVLWICIVTGLVVIFVATSLSSIESAADSHILHSVGASPGVLRAHSACRAGYLALLGCVLAVPAGIVPMAGLLRLSGGSLEFVMPWSTVAIAVLAMPLIAYAGTWSAAFIRRPAG